MEKKIKIQRDQWVPRKSGLKITEFKRRSRLRWVNQLMMPGRKEWDADLVHQMFHEYDAEEICKIRIPTSNVKDCIAWHEKGQAFSLCVVRIRLVQTLNTTAT